MMEHVDEVNFAIDGLRNKHPLRIKRASLAAEVNPFMRGKLYIQFLVDFPDSLTPEQCKVIESVLPPRSASSQLTNMEIDEREETTMHDVNI